MTKSLHHEVYEGLCDADPERIGFTRRAFQLLPKMQNPRILDVGCGKGDPTLELAALTDGVVTGVDIDQASLDELSRRAHERGLADRVLTRNCSIRDMTFPDESLDLIWAEASIHIIGFERGLDDWRGFLKPKGFLVVHEMAWLRPDPPGELADRWRGVYPGIRTVREYAAEIPHHGYDLTGDFTLPDDFWWHHYYRPLEVRIAELREKYRADRETMGRLDREQREVDLYKKYPGWYGSAFLIMRKRVTARGPAEHL